MKNIWFNRWFSSAYHFIKLIKDNDENKDFTVFVTHENIDSVNSLAADYFDVEPSSTGEDYINYCLEFCKIHDIDLFIPYKEIELISINKQRFTTIGTNLLIAAQADVIKILDNKADFYRACEAFHIKNIPHYNIINTSSQFTNMYNHMYEQYGKLCIKPSVGVGAAGFRVIDPLYDDYQNLSGSISYRVSLEQVQKSLKQKEFFDDLMILEYLDGVEYSIDCLSSEGKLICAVPRKKIGRKRVLEYNEALIELCSKLIEVFKLSFVSNIQLKYKNDFPYLLEINPRMSGGLQVSCLSGVNFPYLAVKLALGEEISKPQANYNISVLESEQYIFVDDTK